MKILAVAILALLAVSALAESPNTTLMLKKLAKTGSFSQTQVNNARDMLEACVPYINEPRKLAYVLSTAIGESSLTPIKEYRCSPSQSCYQAQERYWYTGYYGRGYVQLTWKDNYAKFGNLLGIDLVGKPDLALQPATAGKIICIGMAKGLFTGVGLNNYFNSVNDWTNARRIINGMDKAQEFGDRAKRIFDAVV